MKNALLLLTFTMGMQSALIYANPINQNKYKTEEYATAALASFGFSTFAGYMILYSKLDALTPVTAFYSILAGCIGFQCANRALYGESKPSDESMNVIRGREVLENYKLVYDESNVIEGKRILGSFTYKHDDSSSN